MNRARPQLQRSAWPFFALAGLLLLFVGLLIFSRKAPVIASLEPAMAAPGQIVTVSGDYFGRTAREGTLSLAGEIPPPSLIQTWTDQKIVFIVPQDATSGLVSVSNSQGVSTGVLFTNTQAIPTVLQSPAAANAPLVWSVVPAKPSSGQVVTVTGRNFGAGDEAVALLLQTGPAGPVFEIGPSESLEWTQRSVSFLLPPGMGENSVLRVATPRGQTDAFALPSSSAVEFGTVRTLRVSIKVTANLASPGALTIFAPVPQRSLETAWTLSAADPAPSPGFRQPVFSWAHAASGPQTATYTLTLKSWERLWKGLPAGLAAGAVPSVGEELKVAWKPAAAALKTLTAKWGLESADPWLRLTRLQTGLSGAFRFSVLPNERPVLTKTPSELLSLGSLDSYEAATLALFLAATNGIPGRLVSGLWLDTSGEPRTRTWLEVWIAGAGWSSWDPIDGNPGTLDNRHFAFANRSFAPSRLEPRSRLLPSPAPGTLGEPTVEFAGTGDDPSIVWEISSTEK